MIATARSVEQSYTYAHALVLMACVDQVQPAEEQTISRMLTEFGIDAAAIREIWQAHLTEDVVLTRLAMLDSDLLRRSLLKDLILVAYADGDFSDAERSLLVHLRDALLLDESFQRRAEDWVLRGIAWEKEGLALCGLEDV